MPEDKKNNQENTADLLAKIERLETLLEETERARKQGMMIARLSVLVVLIAIGIFIWNLWGFYKSFTQKENLEKLAEQISVDMKDVLSGAEMKMIQDKIYKDTVPKVTEIFIERFKKETPMFKEKGQQLLGNLKEHLEQHLKDELAKALEESMKGIEADLTKKLPNVTPEKLHEALTAAQYVFVEDITDQLEERLVDLSGLFDDLDKIISSYRQTEDYKELSEKELDDVKLELVESVLELAIYEINPPRGEKPYEGGAK